MSSNDEYNDENTYTTYTSDMPSTGTPAAPAAQPALAATTAETGLGTSNPTTKPPMNKRKQRSAAWDHFKVTVSASNDPSCGFTNEESKAVVEEFSALDEFGLSEQKSQLELYMQEARLDAKSNLDVLGFWKGNQYKHPQVAHMARDILSIPITTVASEAVFSVGGRVLDQYRSSLKASTVEAIICTRDWLFGEKAFKSETPTSELAEDFIHGDDEPQTESSSVSTIVVA
ncbi:zinc finger BED domain-containing protein RICESLEEPER 3-like [Salvia miltiorrhiza]|uniref:zinc finger BED domain-containing protein RICESLEEPER 3-like n=1 Tax=Salvia miltiorrhiza TaxID=226208 RepID=UPI0025ABFD1E|nr:zinc finger BED domain-containing protein RICESLEEPER 3-like [Salvia miltiorrhiza]